MSLIFQGKDVENMEKIQEKAMYCLNCPIKPCSKGCPLGNHIPDFIAEVKAGDYEKAYQILCETTVLQPICGKICPHSRQCQGSCVRGKIGAPVSIGELEAYIGNYAIEHNIPIPKKNIHKEQTVAIVGGGPAGLTCAAFLAREGYQVTIYEKYKKLGGILVHGIPHFRLDPVIVEKTIQKILDLGIQVQYEQELEKNLQLSDLQKQYDAIFLAFGANQATTMHIPGETLQGVYGGNTILEEDNHPNYTGKKVAIIGGGNVAMDTARTVQRKGAEEVTVIYRRAEEQMPAERKEIEEAKLEKIHFLFQTNVIAIHGDMHVNQIECIKTELVAKEGETRLSPVNIPNSNFYLPMDYVIMAVGSKPEESVMSTLDIALDKWGKIQIEDAHKTSKPGIFAGGDITSNPSTVAWAARSGRDAAEEIGKYLEQGRKKEIW